MKGDFSRDSFDPRRHFSRVLLQQGRVLLDADWNEQVAILLRYLRALARDLIGPHGGPERGAGFEILTRDSDDLRVRLSDLTGDNETLLLHWRARLAAGDALILPGRYYVQGLLVENERSLLFSEQPGAPALPQGNRLFYLDVWERHVSHVEDDRIRETALGGPDTASRAQIAWQVRGLQVDADGGQGFDALPTRVPRRLRAGTQHSRPSTDPCVIPPDSRYRGPENQLYRVEIYSVSDGESGEATFVWSRENASVLLAVRELNGTRAQLEDLGRDKRLGLEVGHWVEVEDDELVSSGRRGPLARVESVDPDELEVVLRFADPDRPAGASGKHPRLRRWDHRGTPQRHGGALPVPDDDAWVALEDGVQIAFEPKNKESPHELRPGDYWLLPARVNTRDIEWPAERDEATGETRLGEPSYQRPHGPQHYYAPLHDTREDQKDRRHLFELLGELVEPR